MQKDSLTLVTLYKGKQFKTMPEKDAPDFYAQGWTRWMREHHEYPKTLYLGHDEAKAQSAAEEKSLLADGWSFEKKVPFTVRHNALDAPQDQTVSALQAQVARLEKLVLSMAPKAEKAEAAPKAPKAPRAPRAKKAEKVEDAVTASA